MEPPGDQDDKETTVHNVVARRLRNTKLDQIRGTTSQDATLLLLGDTIMQGWPENKTQVPETLRPYFDYRDELSMQDGVIYRGDRIVIPKSMHLDIKQKVHAGHLGINACLRRARDLVYWPGMSKEIRQYVETCATCAAHGIRQQEETVMEGEPPSRAWQKVGSDLFKWGGREYVIVTDYHSNYFEIDQLQTTSSEAVIKALKQQFARHGIPTNLVTDNGAQYISSEFREFTKTWGIEHSTISPGNSQANGAAEGAVKIVKRLMSKSKAAGEDIHLALLNYRNTPTEYNQLTPTQKIFGRRTSTMVPTAENKLKQTSHYSSVFKKKPDHKLRTAGKDLRPLETGDNVRVQPIQKGDKYWKEGQIITDLGSRSYEVKTYGDGKVYRRNRRFLRKTQKSTHGQMNNTDSIPKRTGRVHTPTIVTDEADVTNTRPRVLNETLTVRPEVPKDREPPIGDTSEAMANMRTRSGRTVVKQNYKTMNSEGHKVPDN